MGGGGGEGVWKKVRGDNRDIVLIYGMASILLIYILASAWGSEGLSVDVKEASYVSVHKLQKYDQHNSCVAKALTIPYIGCKFTAFLV